MSDPVGTSRPPLFAIAAFWAFVLGGLSFGGLFVSNLRALPPDHPPQPQTVQVGAGPVQMSVPVSIGAPPVTAAAAAPAPPKEAGLTASLVNVVKTVLPDWPSNDRVNILLLGIDKRDDEPAAGTRSDTMMLASIDPATKSAALVSLPRDMWVNIPGCSAAAGCVGGQQRINVAHAVGGPELAAKTVTADFGVPIDYYARVDFHGFQQMVDLVGGVVIDVDWPVKDDEYPTDDYGYQRIYFGPGPQLMDGRSALEYARSRHGMNDFARAGRQQKVILAVRNRVLQLGMLSKAPDMLNIVQQSVTTNLSPLQMLELAKLMSSVDRSNIANLVIDTNYVTPFVGADGADLLRPDFPAIERAIDLTEREAAHPELKAKVEVLNGSGTVGLGQRAADYLTAQGFNVVRIAAAERSDYQSSSVVVLTDNTQAAQAVASTLKVPDTAISQAPTPNAGADIRILLGHDFRLPTSS